MSRKFILLVLGLVLVGGIFGFTVSQAKEKIFGGGVTNPRINTNSLIDFNPGITSTYNLGSASLKWKDIYYSGTLNGAGASMAGNLTPTVNNTYNIGSALLGWKDVYASGTVYASSTLVGSGIVGAPTHSFAGDSNTGMYNPTADNLAFAAGGSAILAMNTSNLIAYKSTLAGTNNTYDLGAYAYAWRDLYTSGTIYNSGGLQLYGGNVTSTGIFYTGGISQEDPGSPNPALMGELTATPAVGTPQSLDFGFGGDNWLSLYAQSNGVANGYINPAIKAFKSIVPDKNNLINLGSTGTAWASIFASSTLVVGGNTAVTSTIDMRGWASGIILSKPNNGTGVCYYLDNGGGLSSSTDLTLCKS